MDKLVSIILPTYNGSKRIEMAIQSILAQKYSNWELLVLDDGSSDNTALIVDNFVKQDSRIRYIKNEINLGIQKTLNKGLREAKGEYIARIDDDDIWVDQYKLQKQINFFDKNPDYVLLGTGAIIVNEKKIVAGKYFLPATDLKIRHHILRKNCFTHSTVMFRKNTALFVGGYSESTEMMHIEDYDLWLRLGLKGKLANISEYCVELTVSSSTITGKNRTIQAKRILNLIVKYKKIYPNFILGYTVSFIRYVFFSIERYIPIPKKLLYFIQSKQRGF